MKRKFCLINSFEIHRLFNYAALERYRASRNFLGS